jgi:RNA polymerase sigma-70 factor (TIGR02960 family)
MTSAEFEALVTPHRVALHAHCYRMLGSIADADDALQDALVGAWKGIDRFEGRSQLRSWLFTIATNASLAIIAKRSRARTTAIDHAPPSSTNEVDPLLMEPIWIEPYPSDLDDPRAQIERRESLELAFIAALQRLPATQRAVVLLRDVLELSAEETAKVLETTVASANSALQRGRESLARHAPATSQLATLRELGDASQQLVASLVVAWEQRDVAGLSALLARDVKFSMPPIPTWFDGTAAVVGFFAERVFATPWKLVPMHANGQLAIACYQAGARGTSGDEYGLGALAVLAVRSAPGGAEISELTGFLDPAVHARFSLPSTILAR